MAEQQRIEIVQGARGPKARIAGHRIRVQDVVIWHDRLGLSVDEIVEQHPGLSPADVHAALAYYRDHQDGIDQAIQDEERYVSEFQKNYITPLQEKLKQEYPDSDYLKRLDEIERAVEHEQAQEEASPSRQAASLPER